MAKRGANSVAANYVKTAKERKSNPVTETRQLAGSASAILKKCLDLPQCNAIARNRHAAYLAGLLAEQGVEVYEPESNLESLYNTCRMYEIPLTQTADTHPELRCKNEAIMGASTCMQHTPPRTRAEIRGRLSTLMPSSIERAREIIETSPQHGPVVSLIKHVWDVNGFKPTEKLELEMNTNHLNNPLAGFDLSQLSNQELQELITLMRKARPTEGALIKVKAETITADDAELAISHAVNITPQTES